MSVAEFWKRQDESLRTPIVALLVTRTILAFWAWFYHLAPVRSLPSGYFIYRGAGAHAHWLVDSALRWDAFWYLSVVRDGYHFDYHDSGVIPQSNIAFFPLFPVIVRALTAIFPDAAIVGLVVATLATLGGGVLLFRLVRLDADDATAREAVWLFALVPWTHVFTAVYSESCFFFFTIAALLAARKGRFALAGLAGMCAALTRIVGVLVVLPLALEWWAAHRDSPRRGIGPLLWLALVPLGLFAYFVYLYRLTGRPLAFFFAQKAFTNQSVWPWTRVALWWQSTDTPSFDPWLLVIALFLVWVILRFERPSSFAYVLGSVLVILSMSTWQCAPRYLAALFPVYPALAKLGRENPILKRVTLVIFATTSTAIFWLWLSWRKIL